MPFFKDIPCSDNPDNPHEYTVKTSLSRNSCQTTLGQVPFVGEEGEEDEIMESTMSLEEKLEAISKI